MKKLNKPIQKKKKKPEKWIVELSNSIKNQNNLLKNLNLESCIKKRKKSLKNKFSFRVPQHFASKIKKNDPFDPLLLQILINKKEKKEKKKYTHDPLYEKEKNYSPGLLHKYKNRVLIIVNTKCPIHCRYCFRKHFPYNKNLGNKKNWKKSFNYIKKNPKINEVILSGGDPLMSQDKHLFWLIKKIEKIKSIHILRIHTRFPVVIPTRITENLCTIFKKSKLKIVMVTHVNHPKEIGSSFKKKMSLLRKNNVTLLNQSVFLKKINDNAKTLAHLSNKLFNAGIIPYYIHILDKISGSSHFAISTKKARLIIKKLMQKVSGFLVPKLVIEKKNKKSKTLINID